MKTAVPNKLHVLDIAKMFGIPEADDFEDSNWMYLDQFGDDEREEAQQNLYNSWHDGVMYVAEKLFGEHGLILVPTGRGAKKDRPYFYKVMPEKSWQHAAGKIVNTINGVGMFRFDSVRDFVYVTSSKNVREAVLSHLRSIRDWPDVYGGRSASLLFESQLR
jgi:hypothetical protein